jgi:Tol biopolymer transport system component
VLSPDGKLLAYASDRSGEGNLDIWIQQAEGGEPVRLTRSKVDSYEPSFSPTGSHIVFTREDAGDAGIYLIPALGGTERLLAKPGRGARFSPDGKRIAFWAGNPSPGPLQRGELYTMDAAGGDKRRLAVDFEFASRPLWSPAGDRILFVGSKEPAAGPGKPWIVEMEDGEAVSTTIAEQLEQQNLAMEFASDWTERGLLFSGYSTGSRDQTDNLWLVPVDIQGRQATGPARRLTTSTGTEVHPRASATGRVVFSAVDQVNHVSALPLDANSGKVSGSLTQLTQSRGYEINPSVSVDGTKIAYLSARWEETDVFAKDLGSGKELNLTAGPEYELQPKLSPDGSEVAYSTVDEDAPDRLWFSQTPMRLIDWELPLIGRFRFAPVLRAVIAFAMASFRSRAALQLEIEWPTMRRETKPR